MAVPASRVRHWTSSSNLATGAPWRQHLRESQPHIQIAALDALLAYEELSHPEGVAALRTSVLQAFDRATHPDVKVRTIHLLGKLRDPSLVGELRSFLCDPAHADVRADVVAALGHIGTAEARDLVRPLLADPQPRVRAQAVIALWRFPEDRAPCLASVDQMVKSHDLEENLWGVIVVGVARILERWQLLTPFLFAENKLLRFEAALNLGRLNRPEAVGPLVEVLCGQDADLAHYAHRKIDDLNNDVEEQIRAQAEQRLSYKIALEIQRDPHEWLEDYPTDTLQRLHDYYGRIDAHSEALAIDGVLEERGAVPPLPPMPHELQVALMGAQTNAAR